MRANTNTVTLAPAKQSLGVTLKKDFHKNKDAYLMILPVLVFYIIFCYKPMYGAIIAFQDYTPNLGIASSPWVGFKHFADFFGSYYFWRILKNTVVISLATLVFGFPAPIILALLINELKSKRYARVIQTITYMPHFISLVVICSLIKDFCSDTGVITQVLSTLGMEKINMFSKKEYFVPIYVISGIWQEIGWGSVIYLSALASVDQELYEAASIDGAGRLRQVFSITLPSIAPTIVIMLILRMGNIMNVGFEKIMLLYNPAIYDTSDVISTFVYRKGLVEFNWSYSTAVGLFNSLINFIMVISANKISAMVNETSLW